MPKAQNCQSVESAKTKKRLQQWLVQQNRVLPIFVPEAMQDVQTVQCLPMGWKDS
jgi:hypothetical protein